MKNRYTNASSAIHWSPIEYDILRIIETGGNRLRLPYSEKITTARWPSLAHQDAKEAESLFPVGNVVARREASKNEGTKR